MKIMKIMKNKKTRNSNIDNVINKYPLLKFLNKNGVVFIENSNNFKDFCLLDEKIKSIIIKKIFDREYIPKMENINLKGIEIKITRTNSALAKTINFSISINYSHKKIKKIFNNSNENLKFYFEISENRLLDML